MEPILPSAIPPQPPIISDPTPPSAPPVPPVTPPEPPIISPQPPQKKSFTWLIILVILFLLASTGVLAYQYYQLKTQTTNPSLLSQPTLITLPSPDPLAEADDPTVNWNTYINNYWGVSLRYPQDKLTPCPNYATEFEGIRLFSFGFSCPDGTDEIYKIGIVGHQPNQYKEYKKPTTTEQIIIDGKTVIKNTYSYDKTDGPLFEEKESQEIIIPLDKGIITLQQWGNNPEDKRLFSQILTTFKFTD